jgi:hypothetical protein
MKINFTKKEYQTLVEMLLTADWIIRSDEDEPRKETEPYGALRKKVLAHFKEMGMEADFTYDPEGGEYFETAAYEERAPHMRFIEAFEEASFWSRLAYKLAARDVASEVRSRGEESMSQEERLVRLFEITERYEQEFEEHGLDQVMVVTDPKSRMH